MTPPYQNDHDDSHQKAFLDAASRGDLAAVRKLEDLPGVDVNGTIDNVNYYGDTALKKACGHNHVAVVEYLLRRYPELLRVNAANHFGDGALHDACLKGHVGIVQALAQHPQIQLNATNDFQATPLHKAATANQTGVIKFLLSQRGTHVNARDANGDTALHDACSQGYLRVARLLLRHPRIDLRVTNHQGQTAWDVAAGRPDIRACIEFVESIQTSMAVDYVVHHLSQELETMKTPTSPTARGHSAKLAHAGQTLQVVSCWLERQRENHFAKSR